MEKLQVICSLFWNFFLILRSSVLRSFDADSLIARFRFSSLRSPNLAIYASENIGFHDFYDSTDRGNCTMSFLFTYVTTETSFKAASWFAWEAIFFLSLSWCFRYNNSNRSETSKSSCSASSTSSDISEFNDCREDGFREDGLYSGEHPGNISVHLRSKAVESEQLMKLKEELEKITKVI